MDSLMDSERIFKRYTDSDQQLHDCLQSALENLKSIWNEIGISGEVYDARKKVFAINLTKLVNKMVQEEKDMKTKLLENVIQHEKDLQKLCQGLSLPPHEVNLKATVVEQERELRTKVEEFSAEKSERLGKLKELSDADQHLCDALCTTYYIPTGSVPTSIQLTELNAHIQKLENEKIDELLKEYINSEDLDEAMSYLVELNVPRFHHDLVFQACDLAIEYSSDEVINLIVRLLKFLTDAAVMTADQFEKGIKRFYDNVDDISIDVPVAYMLLEQLASKLHKAGILSDALLNDLPSGSCKRFVSERYGVVSKMDPGSFVLLDNQDLAYRLPLL